MVFYRLCIATCRHTFEIEYVGNFKKIFFTHNCSLIRKLNNFSATNKVHL